MGQRPQSSNRELQGCGLEVGPLCARSWASCSLQAPFLWGGLCPPGGLPPPVARPPLPGPVSQTPRLRTSPIARQLDHPDHLTRRVFGKPCSGSICQGSFPPACGGLAPGSCGTGRSPGRAQAPLSSQQPQRQPKARREQTRGQVFSRRTNQGSVSRGTRDSELKGVRGRSSLSFLGPGPWTCCAGCQEGGFLRGTRPGSVGSAARFTGKRRRAHAAIPSQASLSAPGAAGHTPPHVPIPSAAAA